MPRAATKKTKPKVAVALASAAPIRSVALARDGSTAATLDGSQTLRLWDLASGETRWAQKVGKGAARLAGALAFSPDGARIVTATSDLVIHDAASGKVLSVLAGDLPSEARHVAWCGDHIALLTFSATEKRGAVSVTDARDGTVRLRVEVGGRRNGPRRRLRRSFLRRHEGATAVGRAHGR